MFKYRVVDIFILLVIVDAASSFLNISRHEDDLIEFNVKETRRQKKKSQSTSSSSRDGDDSGESAESLGLSISESSSSGKEKKKGTAPVSGEVRGWRKWHRRCTPCPDDMWKKWRDPSIRWICGAYQRARRSFKSLCMMHYRNCQDGTMFVKIHDHRCENDTSPTRRFGAHFFYEYKVVLSDESATSVSSKSDENLRSSEY